MAIVSYSPALAIETGNKFLIKMKMKIKLKVKIEVEVEVNVEMEVEAKEMWRFRWW